MEPLNNENTKTGQSLADGKLPAMPAEAVEMDTARESELRDALSVRYELDPAGPWRTQDMLQEVVAGVWKGILEPAADAQKTQYGSARRVVFLMSDNPNKLSEYVRNFERYGIEVYRVPPIDAAEYRSALFKSPREEIRVINLVREESDLYHFGTNGRASGAHLERVENRSYLKAYKFGKDGIECREYKHSTEGYIDLTRRTADGAKVFGWDDRFVIKNTGKSYFEMASAGNKISSRDMVVSQFLQDQIYYPAPINLRFNPQELARPVDFGCSVRRFVSTNAFFNNPSAVESGVTSLFNAVVNEGIFFRSPENRREKNYWLPGLNAGIPFVPKKDAIHEITYMAHDFGHFMIPDLIFTGDASPQSRATYVAYRMMSEAITMVLADMLFVDTLKRSGAEYDFSKRKIYPLYQDLKLDLGDRENFAANLKTILKANVEYCLRGNDGAYRELLASAGSGTASLEAFKEKYMPFFVEDYRWTARNWENICSSGARQKEWWDLVSPLRESAGLHLETIGEFSSAIAGMSGSLIDRTFERLFETRVKPALERQVDLDSEERILCKAFSRYMTGQLGLMNEFRFVPESGRYANAIIGHLTSLGDKIDLQTIDNVRGYYEQFVDLLCERNLISLDDALTYKEVYPLFPPFFVFYDEEKGFYKDLADIARGTLGEYL